MLFIYYLVVFIYYLYYSIKIGRKKKANYEDKRHKKLDEGG